MVLRSAGLRPGKELRYERLRVAYIDPRVYFDLEIDIACVFLCISVIFYALVFLCIVFFLSISVFYASVFFMH